MFLTSALSPMRAMALASPRGARARSSGSGRWRRLRTFCVLLVLLLETKGFAPGPAFFHFPLRVRSGLLFAQTKIGLAPMSDYP